MGFSFSIHLISLNRQPGVHNVFRTALHLGVQRAVSQGDQGSCLKETLGRLSFQVDSMPRGGKRDRTWEVQAEAWMSGRKVSKEKKLFRCMAETNCVPTQKWGERLWRSECRLSVGKDFAFHPCKGTTTSVGRCQRLREGRARSEFENFKFRLQYRDLIGIR